MAWKTLILALITSQADLIAFVRRLLDLGGDAATRIIFGFSNGWGVCGGHTR